MIGQHWSGSCGLPQISIKFPAERGAIKYQGEQMSEHILMTFTTRRPYRVEPVASERAQYASAKGYWIRDGEPLVTTDDFKEGGSCTKKCDQETGEDLKGE